MKLFTARAALIPLLLLALLVPTPRTSAQPPPAPGGLTPETAARINQLKLDALKAEDKDDEEALNKQLGLYKQILELDPNDALARQRKEKIEGELKRRKEEEQKKREEESKKQVFEETVGARKVLVRSRIAEADQAILDARTTGNRASLEQAKKLLDEARRDAQAGDPEIERLEAQIAQVEHDWWVGRVELWSLIGVITIIPLVALVVYLLKKERLLEVVQGPQSGDRFPLEKDKETVSIGSLGVDWVITDPLRKISRHHCNVVRAKRRYFLIDMSSNGTLVNGRLIERGQPILLKRGDRIGLSDEVTVVFR
jgi:FHA domain-containing protein